MRLPFHAARSCMVQAEFWDQEPPAYADALGILTAGRDFLAFRTQKSSLDKAWSSFVMRKRSFLTVIDLLQIAGLLNALACPAIGGSCLVLSKLSQGEVARRAERRFLAALVVVTIMTVRTVIACDDSWLVYAVTLSIMVVGALLIPGQDANDVSSVPV